MGNVSGHSSAVVKNHYLMGNRNEDVGVVASLLAPAVAITDSIPIPTRSPSARQTTFKHIVYGEEHPHYLDVRPQKVPWSDDELAYIVDWKSRNILTPADSEGAKKRCLAAVRADPDAHKIFHANHVLSADRFRNGYERKEK